MTITAYQARDCASTSSSIEFFATSIAALANGEANPKDILEHVIAHLHIEKSALLAEQSAKLGYTSTEDFESELLETIARQLVDLKYCQLTAAQREQRRLIASL